MKRLFRSRENKVIAGVAGGIAEYFGIDPVIVRLIFILLVVGHGAGALIYIVAWMVIPEAPVGKSHTAAPQSEKDEAKVGVQPVMNGIREGNSEKFHDNGRIIMGLILLIVGATYLTNNIFGYNLWRNFWPLLLVAIGLGLIFRSLGEKNKEEE